MHKNCTTGYWLMPIEFYTCMTAPLYLLTSNIL